MEYEVLATPNSIARGRYSIGENENKLFLKLMYAIQRDNKEYIITENKKEKLSEKDIVKWKELCKIETLTCKITQDDFKEIFKRKNDRTEESLKETLIALSNCNISFDTVTRDQVRAKMIASLVSHFYIEKESGDYQVVVPAKLYRYLFDLGLGHSQNALQIIYKLRGVYAQRLYIILRSWSGTKRDITFSVQELRDMLQIGDKNKTFNSFETNILKRSISEINSTGIMNIEIKEKIKKGRSVDKVVFTVIDNEPRNYLKLNDNKIKDESVLWLDYIKVDNEALKERLELKYSDIDLSSPIVKNLLHRAYDKTLNKDNRFTMIQDKKGKSNFALFNHIASGELLTHELGMTGNQLNDSVIGE